MGNLMTDSYSYKELETKYCNFYVPTMKIKIKGKDVIKSLGLSILDLKVTLSLVSASMVTFQIADIYEVKSHSFASNIKNKFVLGPIVEVELGYLSSTVCVFKGFISSVGASFQELPTYLVTLMDVRRLMMISSNKKVYYDVANYSDAVNTILGNYSALCKTEIDVTDDKLELPISQTSDDYQFIVKDLIRNAKVDREFFVLGEKAYFRKPRKEAKAITKLTYGRELLEITLQEHYLDLAVEVIGYHTKEQKVYKGKTEAIGASNQSKIITKTPVITITDSSVDNQIKATNKSKIMAKKKEWESRTGKARTIGLPEIVPGRFIEVEKLEAMADNTYYISEVVHEMDKEAFATSFTIGGWN